MKRIAHLSFALMLLISPIATAEDLPTGAEVMEKITEASGGQEAMSTITSVITRGKMEIASVGLSGSITTWTAPPGKVRAEIELPGVGLMQRGANGEVAWETNPLSGPRILEGEERDMMLLESTVGWTADWSDYYESVECTSAEDVNGQPCVQLELKMKGGMEQTLSVNRETWLPVSMNMTMEMQGNRIPVVMSYDEYQEFEGLTLPVKITQQVLVQSIVVRFDSYEFNTEIPDDRFTLPEEVQALIEVETGNDTGTAGDTDADGNGADGDDAAGESDSVTATEQQ